MRQFDFARNWRKRVSPHLDRPDVVRALHLGMGLLDIRYQPGDPPWLLGRGPLNGQRARAGGLSWYQPWGRCHHIAPFKWAIAQALFPDLKWGFVSSDKHTVVVGYRDDWMQPELVMDILLFRKLTAEESLARFATERALPGKATSPPSAEVPPPFFADLPQIDPAQQAARRRALSRRAPPEPPVAAVPAGTDPWGRDPLDPPPAELRGGNLDDLPAARLLAVAWKARAAGRLDVAGDASRALWFEDGRVVGASSNAAGERTDEVALRLGLLTRDQHRQVAGSVTGLASRRAAVLLVDRGYLKPGELTGLVRARAEEVVFGIFGEVNARFRWVADPVPADERISLDRGPLALAVEGVRRRWLAPRTDGILGGPATLVSPLPGAPSAEELELLPEERRALAITDGLRTLDEVLAQSPLDALSTRQLLAALVLVGALGVKVVQAGRPAAQVSAGIDLARVKEKLEQVRRADYFTILGLGRVATPHEVRAAAGRLTAEFLPERYRGHQEEGLAARLEEIRRVVADAREVLADPLLREEYQRGMPA